MDTNRKNPWGNMHFISQVESPYRWMPFGRATIEQFGCGVCCTANVAMRMGIDASFLDIIAFYTFQHQPRSIYGLLPWKIQKFFDGSVFNRGEIRTQAELKFLQDGLEDLLNSYEYVIACVKWRGLTTGAHYIACMMDEDMIYIVDPGEVGENMHMVFENIDGYLARYGGGFVIGGVGVSGEFAK